MSRQRTYSIYSNKINEQLFLTLSQNNVPFFLANPRRNSETKLSTRWDGVAEFLSVNFDEYIRGIGIICANNLDQKHLTEKYDGIKRVESAQLDGWVLYGWNIN